MQLIPEPDKLHPKEPVWSNGKGTRQRKRETMSSNPTLGMKVSWVIMGQAHSLSALLL